jgi:hypothetical protein
MSEIFQLTVRQLQPTKCLVVITLWERGSGNDHTESLADPLER